MNKLISFLKGKLNPKSGPKNVLTFQKINKRDLFQKDSLGH